MARKSGTVIPLNYGYHLEHAVAIVDTDWNRLQDLLEDPNRYFHYARKSWKIHGPPDVIDSGWKVTEPATAILTPIHKNFFMVSHALLAAGATGLPSANTQDLRTAAGMAMLLEKKEFQGGFFVVQFAIDTSVIHIGYFPPKKVARRYERGYTNPTICRFGTPGLTCLSAHVDLAEPPSGYSFRNLRANFLMDLVANYAGFLEEINVSSGYLLDCDMVSDTTSPSGTVPTIEVPPAPRSTTAVSSKYMLRAAANYGTLALPTVTVDQMGSTELPGTPCVWPKAVSTSMLDDITVYESEDVVVKYYPEPTPTDPPK